MAQSSTYNWHSHFYWNWNIDIYCWISRCRMPQHLVTDSRPMNSVVFAFDWASLNLKLYCAGNTLFLQRWVKQRYWNKIKSLTNMILIIKKAYYLLPKTSIQYNLKFSFTWSTLLVNGLHMLGHLSLPRLNIRQPFASQLLFHNALVISILSGLLTLKSSVVLSILIVLLAHYVFLF